MADQNKRDYYEVLGVEKNASDAEIKKVYTPAAPADHKLKKARERLDRIELVETEDVLREL